MTEYSANIMLELRLLFILYYKMTEYSANIMLELRLFIHGLKSFPPITLKKHSII